MACPRHTVAMTTARALIAPPNTSGTYHCVQRCVRRAFLCGLDPYSGKSFEHRKDWVEARLIHLADQFAVALLGYAVMANHLHVVLRVDPNAASSWSDDEIARRWLALFPPRGDASEIEFKRSTLIGNPERLAQCRQRLGSLSWFMRCLAEPIARQANAEDQVTGRFWQGRYRCQALLDERAVLAALAYVDLNPIRTGITTELDRSAHTSVQRRIADAAKQPAQLSQPLRSMAGLVAPCLPLTLADYLQLVDWTGRQMRPDKRGAISNHAPSILSRFDAAPERWATEVRGVGSSYWRAIGTANELIALAESLGQRWLKGLNFARGLARS